MNSIEKLLLAIFVIAFTGLTNAQEVQEPSSQEDIQAALTQFAGLNRTMVPLSLETKNTPSSPSHRDRTR